MVRQIKHRWSVYPNRGANFYTESKSGLRKLLARMSPWNGAVLVVEEKFNKATGRMEEVSRWEIPAKKED